jgi:hypothetical protein
MNDAEKLIFEGNLRRLGNKLGVTEKGPAADVLEFGTGEKVSPEGIMSLTEKAGQKNPPTTLMGKLESRIKQLEASGEDLSKLKGKTYDEFMKDITQGQKSMRKLEDEGLVRATAREIIGRDIKSGKIKLPKEIEQDIVQGGGEPINVFRQFYGEDALEQLDSMIPEFKNMYSPREAADAATKKFKFEFKADRPPGSISIEDAKKAEQEFRINKPKQNEVTDITAKVYRNTDPDELINEYNKNLDLLSQVDEEGGTLIGYQQFQKLQNRNTEIEKILNSIGIKSADSPEGKKITEALIGKPKASVTELVTAEKIISDMKNMDPMDAMKEANKVLKKEGKYKNLQEKDVERIMEDTNDYIFGRDIPEDPEGFAKGGRVGMAGERQGYADGDIASGLAIRLNRPVQPGDPIGSYYGGTPIMISNKKVEPTLNRDSQGRLVNSITGKPITTPIFLPLNRELMSSPSKPSMTLRDKLRPLSLNERLQFFATNKPSYDEFYDLLQMNLKGEDRQQAADGGSQGLDYLMGIERRGYANGDYAIQAGIKNYLGKQKTATVPIKWKSGKGDSHPDTELAYITKPEKDLLIKLDMHNSMPDGEPNIGPGGLISLNSGGDGGAGGGGGGGGGSDASGNDTSPGATGGAGGDPGDPGSEASGGGGSTDTGDMGSEAANVSSTQSGAASVGAGDSGPTDTGDLGSEAANDAATAAAAASVGMGTLSSYSRPGMVATNISNYMRGNPMTSLGLTALGAMIGVPALGVMNAANSVYGGGSSGSSTGSGQGEDGSGDGGDEKDGRTFISSFDNALLTPDLLDSYNLAKNRDYRLFQSSNNPFYSLQRNPSGGINNVYTEFKKGGRVGFAEGGSMSKGLDYLSGVERRGYQEGSTLTDLFKRYEDIQTPSGPALDNPDFIPETALGNIERGISDFLKSDRGLKYGKDIPLDINDIYSFIKAQRRSFSPDLSQNYQGGDLYHYLQDFYKYKYGIPRINEYGYFDYPGEDKNEKIFKSYFNQPYQYGLNQTTPTEDLINNLNTTTINTTAQTTPAVEEQMISPEDALTPPAPDVNPLQQHFDQNQMLKDAVARGEITPEQYNVLGGYDVQQTLSPGNPVLGGIGNLIGSTGYNVIQSLKGEQPFSDIPGDVMRNVQGGFGLISPELKQTYQDIVKRQLPYMDQYQKDYQTRISQVDPNALRSRYLQNLQNTSSQDVNQFQSQLRSNLVPRGNEPQGLNYLTGL